jgi:hypothetical protein
MTTLDLLKQLTDHARSFVFDIVRGAVREAVRDTLGDETARASVDLDALAAKVAEHVKVDPAEVAANITVEVDAEEVANHIDADDIARTIASEITIDVSDLDIPSASDIAYELDTPEVDAAEVGANIDIDSEDIARNIDAGEVASALLDKLVARLAPPAPEPPADAEDADSATE